LIGALRKQISCESTEPKDTKPTPATPRLPHTANMTKALPYVHPIQNTPLEEYNGGFIDPNSGERFPTIRGIPRFCESHNYSSSFGYQWNIFDRTQLDTHSKVQHSADRFFGESGWTPQQLENCQILEVGSGAGRFSEVVLRTTKGILHSIDYSDAVEANWQSNKAYGDRFKLSQASIYALPFQDNSFDKVFCFGVLQHTPSFEDSVKALIRKARIGGEIAVDFYPINGWYTKVHSKYLVRPLTKRLPKAVLLGLIRRNIKWLLFAFDLFCSVGLGVLTRFIPITDVRMFPKNLTADQRREWAIMDTFDGLSPEYDNPQRLGSVVKMFERNGCDVIFSGLAHYADGASTVVRATKIR